MRIGIEWNSQGDGVLSCTNGFEDYVDLDTVNTGTLSKTQRMDLLALSLIMKIRKNARDYEDYFPDGEHKYFHNGVLARTNKGRYFLTPNVATSDDESTRPCAEQRMLDDVQAHRENGEYVEEMWIAGGHANMQASPPIEIYPEHEGDTLMCCAVCTEALRWENPDIKINFLPLVKPEPGMVFERSDQFHEREKQKIFVTERNLSDLYKPDPIIITDLHIIQNYARLWEFLQSKKPDLKTEKLRQKFLKAHNNTEKGFGVIGRTLLYNLHEIYALKGNGIRRADVALAIDTKGRFSLGDHFMNGVTSARPPAAAHSVFKLSELRLKGKVTDAYFMHVETADLKNLFENPDNVTQLEIHVPKGTNLARLRKGSKGRNPNIHTMIPQFDENGALSFIVQTKKLNEIAVDWNNPKLFEERKLGLDDQEPGL